MNKAAAVFAASLIAATLLVAAQETAATRWRAVAPGVEHAQLTREGGAAGNAGRWNINLLRVDPSRARLEIVHAHDNAVGLETVSSLAARHSATAAINGGYFRMTGTFGGDSTGTLQIDGRILSEPDRGRAAVGLVQNRPDDASGHGPRRVGRKGRRPGTAACAQRRESAARTKRDRPLHAGVQSKPR